MPRPSLSKSSQKQKSWHQKPCVKLLSLPRTQAPWWQQANATKTVAASANLVFADAAASLEAVNAQITAIRTRVDNLASQLYSFTGSDTLTAMLNATSSTPTAADEEDKKLIAAILDDYTANTQQTVAYDAAAIPGSALVVVQSGTGPDYTYTYKRFAEATTLTKESIKTAFDAGEFKTAADFKAAATYASDKPTVDEKVYVFTEARLSQATSLEESYDLTKFQHRKHLLFNPNDLALGALARPGTFSMDIEMISSGGTSYDPSRYILKENNTLLLVETPTGTYYYDMANPPDYVNENYDSYYYEKQYAYNEYNLFLSHIEDYGVSNQPNDLLNKSNSNLDLPPGVSLVFKAADGSEIRADNKEAIDQYIKAATANMWDPDSQEIIKGATSQLEFKFIVEEDGQVIKQDDNWRSVTLLADGDLLNAITTKTDNTPNDFAAGIVDNIDFSGLPTPLKEQAVEMEKTTQNLDGTTPVDGQLPTFSNPENKNVMWVKQVGEYGDVRVYSLQRNEHGTSPIRVLPNYTDLFTDPTLIQHYIRYKAKEVLTPELQATIAKMEPYFPVLEPIFNLWLDNMEGQYLPNNYTVRLDDGSVTVKSLTNNVYATEVDKNAGGTRYWNSIVDPLTMPSFEEPSGINLEELTIVRSPMTATGSVKIKYTALNEVGNKDTSIVLRGDYDDTLNQPVGTLYDAAETINGMEEKPTTFENIGGKNYTFVRVEKTVNNNTAADTGTSGSVEEGLTVIEYIYAPIQTETISEEVKGDVIINYESVTGETIKNPLPDTTQGLVKTIYKTKRYYIDLTSTNPDHKVYFDNDYQVEREALSNLTYDAAQTTDTTEEKPSIISYVNTNYHFIKLKEGSAPQTGSVTEETQTVTYVYSPEVQEPTIVENQAKVTVNYYILGTNTPLQASYEDTASTKISETVITSTYYLDANGARVPIGTPTEVTTSVDPAVTYDTAGKKTDGTNERPTTLESGGKTYHLVEAATTFTEGTGVSGTLTKDTVVNYYYAEESTPPVASSPSTPIPTSSATDQRVGAAQLPNTGESSTAAASALGVGILVAALAMAGKRRHSED